MNYDLIVVERKWYKKKRFIIPIILLILAILIGVSLYIYLSLNKKEENKIETKQITKHEYNFSRNIQITDQIKCDMHHIYTSEEKRVFLTFDDGPSKTVTLPILDLLKQENIKVTFFTLGSRIEFYPEIVKREYEEGHYVANHGYSHKYNYIYQTPESVLEEYNKTERLIKNAIGNEEYNSYLFRFPGGSVGGRYKNIKNEAINILNQNNIMYVNWNALSGDSEGKKTKEEMMDYLKQTIGDKQSIVILMHDAGDKIQTYEILPGVIQYLREKGYSFKTFYDIIK